MTKGQRVQTYLYLSRTDNRIFGQRCDYWMFCYSKTRQQVWLRAWLLGVLRCKKVNMLLVPYIMGVKSFAFSFWLGYIRTMNNKLEAVAIFTGSPPNSIFCHLSISLVFTPLFRNVQTSQTRPPTHTCMWNTFIVEVLIIFLTKLGVGEYPEFHMENIKPLQRHFFLAKIVLETLQCLISCCLIVIYVL